jgi:hypothetical protein
MIPGAYDGLRLFHGDIHNHCAVSYGHGSPEEAFRNARLQLDFASVVPHAHWHDMPEDDPALAALVDYHRQGFRRAAAQWPHLTELTRAMHEDGRFVTFLSFEWHSMRYGDHVVYYRDPEGEIIRAGSLPALRDDLRRLAARGRPAFAIPHHIAYLAGRRGISWADFTPELSPVVEMVSMHGLAEADQGPYPYLHTMGPRDGRSTMQHGLRLGHVFGVIGSSDHHSAHPGSYGTGRLAVWARALTREGVWEALAARRTCALTGDRIALAFALNGAPMGAVVPAARERRIEVAVRGGAAIDHVELLHDNRPIHRWDVAVVAAGATAGPFKVHVELGWGDRTRDVDWVGRLEVSGGRLASVEPRFRGRHVVSPQAKDADGHAFSDLQREGEAAVRFTTRTFGNPTTMTPSTQGLCLEIEGDDATTLRGRFNDTDVVARIGDLRQGSRAGYLGGFRTPAFVLHRAVPAAEATCEGTFTHRADGHGRDWYYVRVAQANGQYAWSSPIWVEAGR